MYPLLEKAYYSAIKNSLKDKFAGQHDLCIIFKNKIQEISSFWNFSHKEINTLNNKNLPFVIHYNNITSYFKNFKNNFFHEYIVKLSNECNINFK